MKSLVFILLFTFSTTNQYNNPEIPKSFWRTATKVLKIQQKDLNIKEVYIHFSNNDFSSLYELTNKNTQIGYLYVGKCNTCRSGGCDKPNIFIDNQHFEYFNYYMLLSSDAKILKLKIYDYQATHGHEVMNSFWLNSFKGYNGLEKLIYGKNIDALSGATVSAEALIHDIETIIPQIKNYIKK